MTGRYGKTPTFANSFSRNFKRTYEQAQKQSKHKAKQLDPATRDKAVVLVDEK